MQIDLVRTQAADGVRLVGSLREPTPDTSRRAPVDVVILHHGVGGNFYNDHFFDPLSEELLSRGCAVMRVNNRGHDLAYNSPKGRLGAAFESVADCPLDWDAWIQVAAERGYQRIALWGHSLGAVKTIYYLAGTPDPRVIGAIATSPPWFSHSDYISRTDGHLFRAFYDHASKLVREGKPDEVFAVSIPTTVILAAKTYLEKYGPDERFNIIRLLPEVNVPLLVTVGGEEGARPDSHDRFSFAGLADALQAMLADKSNMRFTPVPGADHFYSGKTDELWTAIADWLDSQLMRDPAGVR